MTEVMERVVSVVLLDANCVCP